MLQPKYSEAKNLYSNLKTYANDCSETQFQDTKDWYSFYLKDIKTDLTKISEDEKGQ